MFQLFQSGSTLQLTHKLRLQCLGSHYINMLQAKHGMSLKLQNNVTKRWDTLHSSQWVIVVHSRHVLSAHSFDWTEYQQLLAELVLASLLVVVLVTVVIVAITSSTKGSDSGICNSKTNVQKQQQLQQCHSSRSRSSSKNTINTSFW